MILALTALEKFHPKPSETVFSTGFPYNFWPEVDTDVISDVAVDNVGINVCVKFDDSRSNGFWDIRWADFVSNERINEQHEGYSIAQNACQASEAFRREKITV